MDYIDYYKKWRLLDLKKARGHPVTGEMVIIRMIPINERSLYYNDEKYDIGCFKEDFKTGRKLWWHGAKGIKDPITMKKHYEIWWCIMPEFDGY